MYIQVTGDVAYSAIQSFASFRFLWFVLKDRKFDQAAVDDLVHLKNALNLPNESVAEALKERCVRIEKKFGNLMLNPDGASLTLLQTVTSHVGPAINLWNQLINQLYLQNV